MSSVVLLEDFRGSPAQLDRWMFAHQRTHHNTISRIQDANPGLLLTRYDLYPFVESVQLRWMADHQQAHNDFNFRYGLQSTDLQSVDLKDEASITLWLRNHWQEHLAINRILGIG